MLNYPGGSCPRYELFGWKLSRWEFSYNQFIQCVNLKRSPNSDICFNAEIILFNINLTEIFSK